MENLDFLTAQYGQEIGNSGSKDKISIAVNASLEILHRQGLYALFLWLHENKKNERHTIGRKFQELVKEEVFPYRIGDETAIFNTNNPMYALDNVRNNLTNDILKMFVIKEVISKVLCYARHTIKARLDTSDTSSTE